MKLMVKYSSNRNKLRNLKITAFDKIVANHSHVFFIYNYDLSENTIIDGLAKALEINPYFSGRIVDDNEGEVIVDNNEGVWFSVDKYHKNIPYKIHKNIITSSMRFLMDGDYEPKFVSGIENPLLRVKLIKYLDGSVLEFVYSHHLCDGLSFISFLQVWSNIINKKEIVYPIFDRKKLLSLESNSPPIKGIFSPYVRESIEKQKLVNSVCGIFQITRGMIKQLLQNSEKCPCVENFYMEDDLWLAYICKLVAACRNEKDIAFINVVNVREFLGLNKRYFGNVIMCPFFEIKTEKIIDMKVSFIAAHLRNFTYRLVTEVDLLKQDVAYIKSMQSHKEYVPKIDELSRHNGVWINNVSSLSYDTIDFGMGGPVWYNVYAARPLGRGVFAFPALGCNKDNIAITLQIYLPHKEMYKFRELFKSEVYLN